MSEHRGAVPRWALLSLIGLLAAAAAIVGVMRIRRPAVPAREIELRVAPVAQTRFQEIAAAQNRLWITTTSGIMVIDPVTERWTTLYANSEPVGPASLVPCGSHIWLLLGDSVFLLDPEKRRLEARGISQTPPRAESILTRASCGEGGLWTYDRRSLLHFPVSAAGARRYGFAQLGLGATAGAVDIVEALDGGVYLLVYDTLAPYTRRSLLRFDPVASRLDPVELPPGYWVASLAQVDEGLLVWMVDKGEFLLTAVGRPWVKTPWTERGREPRLAGEDGVVWVGASYDVSPASYFVLRYIQDAAQPRDLVVLPTAYPLPVRPRTAVHYLGMLWLISGGKLLRIDAAAEEIVSYELSDAAGVLDKQSFRLRLDGGQLQYFDGDSLRPLPGTEPGEPDWEDPP